MAGFCPSYEAAVESEQLDRSRAFAGFQDEICGLPVVPLTPLLFDILVANKSPFATPGREVEFSGVMQFLWVVSTEFDQKDGVKFAEFLEWESPKIDFITAWVGILDYLKVTFMDSPEGKASTPYFSLSASLITQMASDPFRWEMEKTQTTAMRIIFQLTKAQAQIRGCTLYNKRSDAAMGDALSEVQKLIDAGEWTQEMQNKINGVT